MNVPASLRYSEGHGWVAAEGEGPEHLARVGLTDYGQDLLGEVEFVELPELGGRLAAGELMAEIEARKATSELYAPLTGRVVAVNGLLADRPGAVNADPYGEGWLCVLAVDDASCIEELMDGAAYARFVGG
ncbi:MAG: glycine cleavage system protein GcvH [bacterium]|nr:glycine cleavage system protein GcvH [bacterium]MCY3924095.1 glycine cleavage system protein GcvH [bacterium]